MRFGEDKDFIVDKTRLEPYDLIRTAFKLGQPFSYDEAMRCLFSIIGLACNNEWFMSDGIYMYFSAGSDRFTRFCTENITILEYAHYYISKMEMTSVIQDIDEWIDKVNETLSYDTEWIELNKKDMNDRDFNDCAETIVKRIIIQLIPDKYRANGIKPTRKGRNDALDALIDTFDLQPDDMPF